MLDAGPQLVEIYLIARIGCKQPVVLKPYGAYAHTLDFQNSSTTFVFDDAIGMAHDAVLFIEDGDFDLVQHPRIHQPCLPFAVDVVPFGEDQQFLESQLLRRLRITLDAVPRRAGAPVLLADFGRVQMKFVPVAGLVLLQKHLLYGGQQPVWAIDDALHVFRVNHGQSTPESRPQQGPRSYVH